MKSECGVWARVEINSEPNKELRLTSSLAPRGTGRETGGNKDNGGGAPRAPAKVGGAFGTDGDDWDI